MKIDKMFFLQGIIFLILIHSCGSVSPPEPYGPVPSDRQISWHQMKYYAFVHFGLNTFTDKEWGFGDEDPALFNPTELDCIQWARTARDAGMEGIIITAKHHDGFCLWPSAYTEHSVKNSPWRNGNGDLLQELREACDSFNLKMGVYLSPWDRNHADYGTQAYIEYYRNQLRELLTNYGEIFEVWFDGAMGGDGYYGGARETRKIDNRVYYDWENTIKIVRELQPNAVIFSDGGPDIRWIGNERGYAADPNWCRVKSGLFYPGVTGKNEQLQTGHMDGDLWLPAEVNTSIRPGWFYHQSQDSLVKPVSQLVENWYHSVGMNGNFLLNLPVDNRGLVHENDVLALRQLRDYLDQSFAMDLAEKAVITASNTRGDSKKYSPSYLNDGDPETYWTTDDQLFMAYIEIGLLETTRVNTLMMQEYIQLGQRVKEFTVEVWKDGSYHEVANGFTIGNRRLVQFPTIATSKIRVHFKALAAPVIHTIEMYLAQ